MQHMNIIKRWDVSVTIIKKWVFILSVIQTDTGLKSFLKNKENLKQPNVRSNELSHLAFSMYNHFVKISLDFSYKSGSLGTTIQKS